MLFRSGPAILALATLTLPSGAQAGTLRDDLAAELIASESRVDGRWPVVHDHRAFLKTDLLLDGAERARAIDERVQDFFGAGAFPSLGVGLVEGDSVVYARALGVADEATGRRATTQTLYEVGSVGKVFTTTVLAILHERGVLRIDDPVERWVPAVTKVSGPAGGGPGMTLENLATHTSGLPGVPANVGHLPPFQWKGYSAEDLHGGFEDTELRHPAGADLVYSTFGMGLLGHVMSLATRRPYEELVAEELLLPLGMRDTVISMEPDQHGRYAAGHLPEGSSGEVPYYEYGILAGGGAHRSTVDDMARFLKAQWGPPGGGTGPLKEGVRSELHRIRWRSGEDDGAMIALGWFAEPREGIGTLLVHRGRTPGHGAVVALVPEQRVGVVLLANRGGRDANIAMADFAVELLWEVVLARSDLALAGPVVRGFRSRSRSRSGSVSPRPRWPRWRAP